MDLSCIISSGDLELYVLGMLSSDDAYKIEQLAQLFPEIKAEIDEIEEALLSTANEMEDAPSAAVKENLFSKLKTMQPPAYASNDTIPFNNKEQSGNNNKDENDFAKIIPMQQPKQRSGMLAAASVIAILIGLGAIAYALISNNQHKSQLAAMQTKADSLQNVAKIQQQTANMYSENLQFYQDTNFRKINLSQVPGKPNALVQLFWNRQTNAVYVSNISLPQAPAGKQYQLWAIVNGKPVSAGMLSNTKQLAEPMSAFPQADAFAITLEKEGGSATPTMTEMYVIGKPS